MTTGTNYENPLDLFKSYSTQFILTVASTTESFRKMVGSESSNGKSPLISKVLKHGLGEKVDLGGDASAYLLIDTRRFSQFSITDIDMEHVYGTGSVNNPTTPISTTKMKVIDSSGFTFFNLLMDVFRNKLKTTHASAFFMLTVLFVGHGDGTETDHIVSTCNIPLTLLLMDMSISNLGSEYNLEFIETEGSLGDSESGLQKNSLGNVRSITTSSIAANSNNLGTMFDALEERLNIQSLEFYKKYSNDFIKNTPSEANKQYGKLVQYMITIPPEWRNFQLSTAAKSINDEQYFSATTPNTTPPDAEVKKQNNAPSKLDMTPAASQLTFAPTMSITDALKAILECSMDILELASQERRIKGTAVSYKTLVTTTSDDSTYTLHFDIYPYVLPKAKPDADNLPAGDQSGRNIGDKDMVKNVMYFDYLFTGKNNHIIDLKIQYSPTSVVALDTNLSLGGNRFSSVAATGGQNSKATKDASKGEKASSDFSPQIRPGDPIFCPMKSAEEQTNNAGQKTEDKSAADSKKTFRALQEYKQTMAFLHFISSISMDISVRGNPQILRKYADRDVRNGIPPHGTMLTAQALNSLVKNSNSGETDFKSSVKSVISKSKQEYYEKYYSPRVKGVITADKSDTLMYGHDVATLPVFVKLNIKNPNVDVNAVFKQGEDMYTNDFFFNGPYQVLIVKTTFSGGEFIHNMTLIPYDIDGSYSSSGDDGAVKK